MRAALLLGVFGLALTGIATVAGQTADGPRVYTIEQAESGRIAVERNSFGVCTDCHATKLSGRKGHPEERPELGSLREDYRALIQGNRGVVPDLVGSGFRARWSRRSTKELTAEFLERFAGLSEDTRLNLVSYILQSNGAVAGPEPLTMTTDVNLRDVLTVSTPE